MRQSLTDIEATFPPELMQLKHKIKDTKRENADVERKTKALQQQLLDLRAKAEAKKAAE